MLEGLDKDEMTHKNKSEVWKAEWWKSPKLNSKKKKGKTQTNEASLGGLWDTINHTDTHIIGSQREKKDKGVENLFEEIMAENLPNLGKETEVQVQESQRVPNKGTL